MYFIILIKSCKLLDFFLLQGFYRPVSGNLAFLKKYRITFKQILRISVVTNTADYGIILEDE